MTWSSSQYLKFEDERSRPARDLVAAMPEVEVTRAVDLGCGPGNSTQALLARFPRAAVTGLDSSQDMIEAARERLPQVLFDVADIATWQAPEPLDLVFSNAALQWLPNHDALFPALMRQLAPGGCLAVQMPDNLDEPSHRLMREVAADGPWAAALTEATTARAARHPADWYFSLLRPHAARVDVWRTTYFHPLRGGAGAVVEWLKGTGLRPYLAPLDDASREKFLARYETAVAVAYPALPDGTVLLPFPRLFIVATC